MYDLSDRYLSRIAGLLSRLVGNGLRPSLHEILPYLRGAPPEIVWALLSSAGFSKADHVGAEPASEEIEAHPLDYDWKFTRGTAQHLVALASSLGERVAAFGTPSVYRLLNASGVPTILVDRNPLRARQDDPYAFCFDLCSDSPTPCQDHPFDVVLLDAPWYPEILLAWLDRALRMVRKDGTILFSVWGDLTRPTAALEREEIFDSIGPLGTLTIYQSELAYETPLFEAIALHSVGIPVPSSWRRGDLIQLKKEKRSHIGRRKLCATSEWHRFTFGSKQVALRARKPGNDTDREVANGMFGNTWTMTSVSRRDPTRKSIDLWLSNSRVARLNDIETVCSMLYKACMSPSQIDQSLASNMLRELDVSPIEGNRSPWRHQEWAIQS